MWDFGQYNLVVKQVEGCSDILRDVLERTRQDTIHTRVSSRLQKHLEAAITDLDKRALRMLAIYDGYAQDLVKEGKTYDPRRDMFRRKPQSAHDPKPLATEAPKKAPKGKKTPK